jgi:hypothetical protein
MGAKKGKEGIMLLISAGLCLIFLTSTAVSDITYTFHLEGVDTSIRSQIENAVQEAVALYNKHGSFNKSLHIYYSSGVPTAQANYDGVITFGGSRNTRVALHEISHTLGVGTFWAWSSNFSGNVWIGAHAVKQIQKFEGSGAVLYGDSQHYWPYGLNYDSEDSFINRIRHVRMDAALTADMGFLSFVQEPLSQVVPLGETAAFHLEAAHAQSYTWYKQGTSAPLANGGRISGANTNTLQIADVQAGDQGTYYCVASGSLTSRPARLLIQQDVGYWPFDGNPKDALGSNNGIPAGNPAYTTGHAAQAIILDGVDDYITLPAGIADARDMTVAAWVYWNGGNQWQRIFDFGNNTSQYLFLTPRSGSNTLRFAIKNGDSEQIVETSQLSTSQWVHLAVVLRENTATLYKNGKPVSSSGAITLDPIDFSPALNYIGKSLWSADPLFSGRIDEFRVYSYALSGPEIWNLWGAGAGSPPSFAGDPILLPDAAAGVLWTHSLAAYAADPDGDTLTFTKIGGPAWLTVASNGTLSGTPAASDEGDNAFVIRAADPSGAGDQTTVRIRVSSCRLMAHYRFDGSTADSADAYHGTATGNPAYTAGVVSQAIMLDGTDDFVSIPADLGNTEDFTLAAWVYWNGGNQWQRIFDFGTGTTAYMFLTPRSGSNTLRFAITTAGNGLEQRMETSSQLPAGKWVHIAVTLKGSIGTLYLNGSPVAAHVGMTLDPADLKASAAYIGKSQFSADPLFSGRIDDLRIWNSALPPAAVAKLAKAAPNTQDLADLSEWWLWTPPACLANNDCLANDWTGDGTINLADLAELARRWL